MTGFEHSLTAVWSAADPLQSSIARAPGTAALAAARPGRRRAPSLARVAAVAIAIGVVVAPVSGCTKRADEHDQSQARKAGPPPIGTATPAMGAAATPAPPADPCAGAKPDGPLAWFEDDYPAALACAQATQKPIFLDDWAPWCHTCLSMRHTVLVDPGLAPFADRFVWLSLDTDKEINAEAVAKFPPQVWPTFFVVSPVDESIQARYLGAASLDQLRTFMAEGERGYLESRGDGLDENSPLGRERAGDRAVVAGDWAAAAEAYAQALKAAPADWDRRPDVLVKQISAYYKADLSQPCVALAEASLDQTGIAASASDFMYYAHTCAGEIAVQGRAQALRRKLAKRLAANLENPEAPLSTDDRSDGLRILREIYLGLGDEETAVTLADRQKAVLDQAWTSAPTAFARMTFVWHRAEVYVFLGQGEQVLSDIEALEADLPTQYDPPHRLAWVLHHLDRNDEALVAAERALEKIYGPRKGRVIDLIADIHAARGDRAAALEARKALIAHYENLPAGQKQPAALDRARAALAELEGQNG